MQLEMDTGKSLHDAHPQWSLIDLNRAGSGLMEVVTAPGMASGEEAACFVRTFQRLLRHLGTGTGNMEVRARAAAASWPRGRNDLGCCDVVATLRTNRSAPEDNGARVTAAPAPTAQREQL